MIKSHHMPLVPILIGAAAVGIFVILAVCVGIFTKQGSEKDPSVYVSAGEESSSGQESQTESMARLVADSETEVQSETQTEVNKTQTEAAVSLFSELPSEFTFSSGAGAWATGLELSGDGTFTGEYYDSEMGLTGDEYPNGTVYLCNFSGKFSEPQRVSEYSYSMRLESLETEYELGEEYVKDGVRYIMTEPYGLDDADEFYIYLPGMPVSEMPEEFLEWVYLDISDDVETMPSGYYGLYNVSGKEGFIGMLETSEEQDVTIEETEETETEESVEFTEVEASSTLADIKENSYDCENLLDGDSDTAWVEGASDDGIGEYVIFYADQIGTLQGIRIKNGYNKTKELFYKNNRVARLRLEFSDGSTEYIDFSDGYPSTGEIQFTVPKKVFSVKMVIESVYAGRKYSDTCIDEVEFIN